MTITKIMYIVYCNDNFNFKNVSVTSISPLKKCTHIIRNGELMGAGGWSGIQTWVRDKRNQGGILT